MDSSDIKNLLKTAKEAIKNKEFKEALKICKSIIDKEKENYLAWVYTRIPNFFVGCIDS